MIYKWQEKSQHFYVFKNKSLSHYEIDPMERSAEQTKDHQGKGNNLLKSSISLYYSIEI